MFRVQAILPNMAIAQIQPENIVYKFLYFILVFQQFSPLLFLYLDMDPEHSPFNIQGISLSFVDFFFFFFC